MMRKLQDIGLCSAPIPTIPVNKNLYGTSLIGPNDIPEEGGALTQEMLKVILRRSVLQPVKQLPDHAVLLHIGEHQTKSCYLSDVGMAVGITGPGMFFIDTNRLYILPAYLSWYLRRQQFRDAIRTRIGNGRVLQRLALHELRDLSVAVPDMAMQEKMIFMDERIRKARIAHQKSISLLGELGDSLAQGLKEEKLTLAEVPNEVRDDAV